MSANALTLTLLALAVLVSAVNIYAALLLQRRYHRIYWWNWGSAAFTLGVCIVTWIKE